MTCQNSPSNFLVLFRVGLGLEMKIPPMACVIPRALKSPSTPNHDYDGKGHAMHYDDAVFTSNLVLLHPVCLLFYVYDNSVWFKLSLLNSS